MDAFSCLSDDLVIHILSFLPTNEAASTCLLSQRWQHLWKLTGVLRISSFKRRSRLGHNFTPESSYSDRSFKMAHLNLSSCNLPPYFKEFRNLKSIHLSEIILIPDDALESINHNCTLLEQLTLVDVYGLKNLRLSSSLSRLKDIYISCHGLESVVIESPNLVSFEYSGKFPTHVYRVTAPWLKKLIVIDRCQTLLSTQAWMDKSIVGDLVTLDLELKLGFVNDFDHSRPCLLNHVKELSLRAVDGDLSGLDAVLRASSYLESLSLSLVNAHYGVRTPRVLSFGYSSPIGNWKHQFLRKIRVEGCSCNCYELILLKYLFRVAVESVEIELVMDSRSSDDLSRLQEFINDYIGKKIPREAKLIVHPYRLSLN